MKYAKKFYGLLRNRVWNINSSEEYEKVLLDEKFSNIILFKNLYDI